MTDEKTYTIEEITNLLMTNPIAVDRAICRLYDNFSFVYVRNKDRIDYYMQNRITEFARFVRGQDKNGKVRWEPKSLSHRIADRQLKKLIMPKDNKCIETARNIALMFVEYLTAVANNTFEKEALLLDTMDLPEHINLGRPSQKRYGDRYEYDAYLKSLNTKLPPPAFPTSKVFERKSIEEIIRLQAAWKSLGKFPVLSEVDPQHIVDRYDFVKTTHCYLD